MPSHSSQPNDAEFVAELTRCQGSLAVYVQGLLPGDRAAADVLQQANAKIWEKREDFEIGTHFRAWAMAIARYEVLNYRKQQARDARLRFSDEMEQTLATELQDVSEDLNDRQEALRRCLDGIPSQQRELLFRRYAAEESLVEFAKRMGRSAGGLKVTLHRIRNRLADCVEARLATEGDAG
ncbi:MAG: sigma-70 family RNA polymerase sigma factor [Planctomycetota bacterium]